MVEKKITPFHRFDIRWDPGNATASNIGKFLGICEYDTKKVAKEQGLKLKDVLKGKQDIIAAWNANRNPTFEKGGNIFTRWGNFYEDTAVAVFEKVLRIPVGKSNYWQHPDPSLYWLYATPDGLIDIETILEIKNPWKQVHATISPEYMAQMQTQMSCAERKKAFFMSQCIKTDKAKIWKLNYSTTYYNWMMPQLQHWHDTAIDPCGELDLTLFDRKPPHVKFELVAEVPSLKAVLGSIPVYDEIFSSEACRWGSTPVFRSERGRTMAEVGLEQPFIKRLRSGVLPADLKFDWNGALFAQPEPARPHSGVVPRDVDGTQAPNKSRAPDFGDQRPQKQIKIRDLLPTEAEFF